MEARFQSGFGGVELEDLATPMDLDGASLNRLTQRAAPAINGRALRGLAQY